MSELHVVIDNGSRYTKMGFSGNKAPSHVIPSVVSRPRDGKYLTDHRSLDDLDFYTGEEAFPYSTSLGVEHPIRKAKIENWIQMERLWQQCIFKYLNCDPENHYFLLTEPPLNPPENREFAAEVMFETFNVPGLYLGPQPVLALAASWTSPSSPKTLTGTIVSSGDTITQVVPVADGYVVGCSIRSIDIAGQAVTEFIRQMLRDRDEKVPPHMSLEVAQEIKEKYCYVCPDLQKEFEKYDTNPENFFKKYEGIDKKNNQSFTCDVGYEQFLGPEVLFNPEIVSSDYVSPLTDLIDSSLQSCPIEYRRALYKNVVLSGGSTQFKDFPRRIERDLQRIVQLRQKRYINGSSAYLESEVKVISHKIQHYAVWFGGSVLATTPEFPNSCRKKAEYEEMGSAICRYYPTWFHEFRHGS